MWIWTWIWIEMMRLVHTTRLLALVLMVFMLVSCGITAPRSNEGYANLDRFLDDEPETQALLRSLDGVRIRTYEVYGDHDRIVRNLERMGGKLLDDGWDPVMLVREEGELVQMYIKSSAESIHGLTIVSADESEVVVVNVMGDIDPVYYGDVMLALDMDDAPEIQVATVD